MKHTFIKKTVISAISLVVLILFFLFSPLKTAINNLIAHQVSPELIYLLLLTPLLSLFITITRIIIGSNISTLYLPSILTIFFFSIGLEQTLVIFLGSIIIGILTKMILSDFHYHFTAKISLIISAIAIFILLYIGHFQAQSDSISLIILATPVIYLLCEKYLSFKLTKNNLRSDLKNILKTLAFCLASFIILGGKISLLGFNLEFSLIKNLILNWPEIILITLLLNILVGQYTGLRVDEIIRFRHLIFKSK